MIEPGLRGAFGFDLDTDRWVASLGVHETSPPLGNLGRFEMLGIAGRGGQGIVYKVREPQTGRQIALKRLMSGPFATAQMHARFEREFEATMALSHPNVVTVYGNEIIEGQTVLAMQWIDGVPFDRWAAGDGSRQCGGSGAPERKGARRDVREVLATFVVVCGAVQHAHQRGVIHRDLKPSNILVSGDGQPHVLDFGLAKLDRPGHSDESLTHTGAFLGTAAYAAPEVVAAAKRSVDVRTDAYSLGAVLFHALTGQPVFDTHGELPQLFEDIQHRLPRAASAVDRRLDREIDAILFKTLAKDPEQRYASVEALGADVQRYLDGAPVLAHPPSAAYRARKFLRRHALSSSLAALLLAAVSAGGAGLVVQAARERSLRRESEVARARADEQEAVALAEAELQRNTTELLLGIIRRIAAHSTTNVPIPIGTLARTVRTELGRTKWNAEPEAMMTLQCYVAIMWDAAGDYKAAAPHRKSALDIALSLFGSDDLTTALVRRGLANSLRRLERYEEAEEQCRAALAVIEKLAGPDSLETATTLCVLAKVLLDRGETSDVERILLDAIRIRDDQGAEFAMRVRTRELLADCYASADRDCDALATLADAMRILTDTGRGSNRDAARVRFSQGKVLYRMRDLNAAEAALGAASSFRLTHRAVTCEQTHAALVWHGRTLHALRRCDEAAEAFERAIALDTQRLLPKIAAAMDRFELCAALFACGHDDQARRQLLRAISQDGAGERAGAGLDAARAEVEALLRNNAFVLDAALKHRLGPLGWLMDEERSDSVDGADNDGSDE